MSDATGTQLPSSVTPEETPRQLSAEEWEKLEKDLKLVPPFWQKKYEKEAARNWDLFYKRNQTNFYKDRHWTHREFEDLNPQGQRALLEVGCGVGNMFFPLLEEDKDLFVHACDFSPRAIQFIKDNPAFDANRINAFVCDAAKDDLAQHVPERSVSIATMIFMLSAVAPTFMADVMRNVYKVLRPGGKLLFRDYGVYDSAMIRFDPGHKLGDRFYVRQDGTRAYYFDKRVSVPISRTMGELTRLAESAGFAVERCEYIQRETVNKKEGVHMPRIFVQAVFVRPADAQP